MASILPNGKTQFIDQNGKPLVNGTVTFYLPGTTTKKDTYQDAALTQPNTNPVVLDSKGQATIWGNGSYRQVTQDALGVVIWDQVVSAAVSSDSLADSTGSSLIGTPDGSTLANALLFSLNRVVDSIAALRATNHVFFSRAFVTGYYAPHDGGGGAYQYDPNDSSSADNGGTIIVANDGARWKLQWSGSISLNAFGAKCDGSTDDTSRAQACLNYLNSIGGGVAYVPFGQQCLINANLTVPANVTLKGPRKVTGTPGNNGSAPYGGLGAAIKLNSTATITIGSNAEVNGLLIYRNGMTFPANDSSAFAGTALTVGGDDASSFGCMILGFNKAFYCSGFQRPHVEYMAGDNVNGIEVTNCLDIPYISNCHFWPFATIAGSGGASGTLRAGTAYNFHDTVDFGRLTNCFSYGYLNGFTVNNCSDVTLTNCSTDYPNVSSSSIGIQVIGTGNKNRIVGGTMSWQGTGIKINVTSPIGNSVSIIGATAFNSTNAGIQVQTGTALIMGCNLDVNPIGVDASLTGYPVSIIGNYFDTCTLPIKIQASGRTSSNIRGNVYYNCTDSVGELTALTNAASTLNTYTFGANAGVVMQGNAARGTPIAPTAAQNTDRAVGVFGAAYDGSTYGTAGAWRVQLSANATPGSTPGLHVFSTTPSGSGASVDRIALDSTGNFYPLTDNAMNLGLPGNRWATVYAATGTINTSDANTKTDVADETLGLAFINSLRPVSYKFVIGGVDVVQQIYRDANGNECSPLDEGAIPSEIVTQNRPGVRTHHGLIAQEVKAAADAAGVDFGGWTLANKDDPNSMQGLRYDQFIAPLVKSVQQLSSQIAVIQAALTAAGIKTS